MFKTIYFPPERTRSALAKRLTISVTNGDQAALPPALIDRLSGMSSIDLRRALGDPFLEDIAGAAATEGRSVSNYCLQVLRRWADSAPSTQEKPEVAQRTLPFAHAPTADPSLVGVTFRDSKRLPLHRWYPYVEGFSADYVSEALRRFGPVRSVYDPFGGAGTCQVEASAAGIPSYYSEVNPLMRFVADTKVNASIWARAHMEQTERVLRSFVEALRSPGFSARARGVSLRGYEAAFDDRDYFEEPHLRDLLAARDLSVELANGIEPLRALMLLAVAANTVKSSNMTRRADLRRRRADEYKNRVVDVSAFVADKVHEMLDDLRDKRGPRVETRCVSHDARAVSSEALPEIELALTSPPYLNGTNYCRNTKLEMWLLGWLAAESDLHVFRKAAIAAGINNVSKDRADARKFDSVEPVVTALAATDGDQRIPLLVRYYFSDMMDVLASVFERLRPGGRFVLDIGDSKFYGVHVPTDVLLGNVAEEAGYVVEESRMLARRYSHDKSKLQQVELVLRKPTIARQRHRRVVAQLALGVNGGQPTIAPPYSADGTKASILTFGTELPFKRAPFSKRNWGHALHSLCSYQGKLKPSIAHWLVSMFSAPGMTVLDPLGGVGTVAFEASCLGRVGISNDMSPLAYAVATGKVEVPDADAAEAALQRFEKAIVAVELRKEDFESAAFGLNGTVVDFFHQRTLEEVLRARRYFLELATPSAADLFVKACMLHVLHGNRPYALSRHSHPITPFHPKGPTRYKPVVGHVRNRAAAALGTALPEAFIRGRSYHGDFRQLPRRGVGPVDRIITSPPFLGMRFDRPNWLRLWFCGWSAEDFHQQSQGFLEREQVRSLDVYREFFVLCQQLLAPDGLMVLHLGGSDKHDMVGHLVRLASESLAVIDVVSEDVTKVERHGVRDRGLTKSHEFIFLSQKS